MKKQYPTDAGAKGGARRWVAGSVVGPGLWIFVDNLLVQRYPDIHRRHSFPHRGPRLFAAFIDERQQRPSRSLAIEPDTSGRAARREIGFLRGRAQILKKCEISSDFVKLAYPQKRIISLILAAQRVYRRRKKGTLIGPLHSTICRAQHPLRGRNLDPTGYRDHGKPPSECFT